ncbi:MAG: CPBP family intramembrane metalloprotease [Anaerolineales bacterium]|nr:CPBP family intramembrane metalloprotease [Anaerolineales bacterium]
MKTERNNFGLALVIIVVWVIIVLGGEMLQAGAGSLDALVTQRLVIALMVAPLFLVGVIVYFKWPWAELGLKAPQPPGSLWLGVPPALFILAFMAGGIASGLPPAQVILFVLINTLLVGVSEELMFRGIVFWAALPRFSLWTAIWISSILFGGVHTLNALMTGDYIAGVGQAMQAALFGVWITAIRLRTHSILPAMLIHGLWDFSIFLLTASAAATAASSTNIEPGAIQKLIAPVLLELPLFLYGLWLLRGLGKKDKAELLK